MCKQLMIDSTASHNLNKISTIATDREFRKMTCNLWSTDDKMDMLTANTSNLPPNTTPAVTDETPEGLSQLYVILTTFFFSFVILVGLTGNSLVVAALARCREMRTPCNLLIANICAADLGVCLLAAPLRIIEIYRGWLFGDVLCYILAPLQDVFVVVSVFTQTVIALERHRAIVTPFTPKINVKRVKRVVPVIWIACYVTSGVPVLIFLKNKFFPNGYFFCSAFFPSKSYKSAYKVYLVVFFIILPLVLQIAAYLNIIRALNRANRSMKKKTFRDRERQKKRLVRILILLMLAFQVCYLPRGVIMLINEFSPETKAKPDFRYVHLITLAMYYLKHVINPIILSVMSKDFRSDCLCRWQRSFAGSHYWTSHQVKTRHWIILDIVIY